MITATIAESIFQPTQEAAKVAQAFLYTVQEDIGLEWVGRHSFEIGRRLFYLRIASDAPTACLRLNELIGEWCHSTYPWRGRFPYMDDDTIDVNTIKVLVEILESEPYVDQYFIDGLNESILEHPINSDSKYLKPLDEL